MWLIMYLARKDVLHAPQYRLARLRRLLCELKDPPSHLRVKGHGIRDGLEVDVVKHAPRSKGELHHREQGRGLLRARCADTEGRDTRQGLLLMMIIIPKL